MVSDSIARYCMLLRCRLRSAGCVLQDAYFLHSTICSCSVKQVICIFVTGQLFSCVGNSLQPHPSTCFFLQYILCAHFIVPQYIIFCAILCLTIHSLCNLFVPQYILCAIFVPQYILYAIFVLKYILCAICLFHITFSLQFLSHNTFSVQFLSHNTFSVPFLFHNTFSVQFLPHNTFSVQFLSHNNFFITHRQNLKFSPALVLHLV